MKIKKRSQHHLSKSKEVHLAKEVAGTHQQSPLPFGPSEFDGWVGPGTSQTLPLFLRGLVSLIKRPFSRKK